MRSSEKIPLQTVTMLIISVYNEKLGTLFSM